MMKKAIMAMTILSSVASLAGYAQAQASVPAFYEAAAKIKPEGALGQIVSQEEIGTSVPGARAWRIAYVSSDLADRKSIVTAVVIAPAGETPAGGRPVIAWAHGTTGTAQNCGPSQVVNPAKELNEYFLIDGDSWTDYGQPGLEAFIGQGYVVVATDYQGLGGGGRHQYAVAATQARDVLNSIRAARSMQATGAGDKAVIYGWSQGGGAALAAASLPASDDTQLLGVVALAPFDTAPLMSGKANDAAGAEKLLQDVAGAFSDNVFNFAHFAMNMWGTQAAFPQLNLTDLFTADGAKAVDRVFSNKCMHSGADTLNFAYGATYKSLLNAKLENAQAWVKALVQGSVAPVKPLAPVVIYWGTKDTVVPPVMGKLYQDQMCQIGGNVARVQLMGEQTHYSTPGAAKPLFLQWVKDRIDGKPATNACPTN